MISVTLFKIDLVLVSLPEKQLASSKVLSKTSSSPGFNTVNLGHISRIPGLVTPEERLSLLPTMNSDVANAATGLSVHIIVPTRTGPSGLIITKEGLVLHPSSNTGLQERVRDKLPSCHIALVS